MAVVIDLFSWRVVGRSAQAHMTAKLVMDARMTAIWRRGTPRSVLYHSGQGSQCSSEHFQDPLKEHSITCSMSRSGDRWDNAAMESFFSSSVSSLLWTTNFPSRDAMASTAARSMRGFPVLVRRT